MVSVTFDNSESSLVKKEMETSATKGMLALPSPSKRAAWKSIVDSVVKSINNEELKSSLLKIGRAEKIPIKWNRLNQPKFSNFLNNISGYQVNPKIDEQSWELISKALEQCKNRDKNDISKSDATNNVLGTVENVKKRKSEIDSINEESGNKKIKEMIKKNESIEKEEVSRLTKIEANKLAQKRKKDRKKQRRSMECAEWQEIILSMIPEAGNNQDLIRELRIVSNASNLPHKQRWSTFYRNSFMMFLNNMPAYSINQTTDELWNLVSKALKKYNEIPKIATPVESAKVPKINIRKKNWLALWKNVIVENTESELVSNLEKISQFEKFPKYLNKLNREIFMRFLKNVAGYPSNPTIDEKVWKLFSNALEERNKNITVNATATTTNEEEKESKSQVNETINQAEDTLKRAVKVKWCTIGKNILGVQDNYELSLENFQKLIVGEFIKQTGNDSESVEALWSNCYKKLSNNSKFQIVNDKVKLVS